MTRMYGPAVRCKKFRRAVGCGLASMYPASDWSGWAPGHHGYQRAGDLISGQASTGPNGSPVFARAGKTDPPSLRFLSQTSAGKQTKLPHRLLLISSVPLFVPGDRSFVPTCTSSSASRAGAVKAGRRAYLTSRTAIARPRLDGSEHGANITRVGRPHCRPSSSQSPGPWPALPRRCARACWRAQSPARCDAIVSCVPRSRI
jgi:hypothetical protein